MQVPLRIVVKNVPRPDEARALVREAAAVLERFHGRITSCRVAITNPENRHAKGGLYDVHVVLGLPARGDIVISRRAGDQPEREHLRVSLRKAFALARRRIQDAAREMRGDVKSAAAPQSTGRVAKLFARSGYGIIEDDAGREVYFHRNSVLNGGFAGLKPGARIRFVEIEGDKGPQASTVVPVATRRARKAPAVRRGRAA